MKENMAITSEDFVRRADIWFNQELEEIHDVDVVYYYYQSAPPTNHEVEFDQEYTLLLDLTQDQYKLWRNIKRDNRYKIRKAVEKDRIVYEFWDRVDSALLKDFLKFHKQFTVQQSLNSLSQQAISRLRNYADAGVLNISLVKSIKGNPLAWRVYYYSENRVMNLHSASLRHSPDASLSQLVGRANRYHCWQDILKFKDLGVLLYDFGGLYANTTDPHLLNINQFKSEFAGELVRQFNWRHGITLKGKLFLRLRKLFIDHQSQKPANSPNQVFPEIVL